MEVDLLKFNLILLTIFVLKKGGLRMKKLANPLLLQQKHLQPLPLQVVDVKLLQLPVQGLHRRMAHRCIAAAANERVSSFSSC